MADRGRKARRVGPSERDRCLGQRLRDFRRTRRLTLQQVAADVGVTYQQIQKYEAGSDRLSASMLFALSGVLGVPVDMFYQRTLADDIRAIAAQRGIDDAQDALLLADNFARIDNPDVRRLVKELAQRLKGFC